MSVHRRQFMRTEPAAAKALCQTRDGKRVFGVGMTLTGRRTVMVAISISVVKGIGRYDGRRLAFQCSARTAAPIDIEWLACDRTCRMAEGQVTHLPIAHRQSRSSLRRRMSPIGTNQSHQGKRLVRSSSRQWNMHGARRLRMVQLLVHELAGSAAGCELLTAARWVLISNQFRG